MIPKFSRTVLFEDGAQMNVSKTEKDVLKRVPVSKPPFGLADLKKMPCHHTVSNSHLFTLLPPFATSLILRVTLGYPLYLIFDMYDPDYGSFSNHFWSQAGIFNDSERDQIVLSNVGIMVVLYAFYRKVVKKADYGTLMNWAFHDANPNHAIHHLFPTIPLYHASEVRDAVKPILGDYYKLDDTPILKALWRDTKCIYVEPDENSEVKGVYRGSGAGAGVSVLSAEGNVVEENVLPEGAFLDLTDPECDVTVAEKDVAQKRPGKAKRKKLLKRSDPLPAKRLRTDHPSLASGGVTSSRGKTLVLPTSGVGGSSQPETSEESTDSFYETVVLNSEDAKRWSARQICLGSEACDEAKNLISSLSSEKDGLVSEVSIIRFSFGFYRIRWERPAGKTSQELTDFPLIPLLKSKKDSGMDEVLDCFFTSRPLANLPEAAYLQPCLEQLSVPIYYADVNAVVGETSLSFALLNVHNRAEGARKHAAALRRLMVDIVSHPLSSQNLLGEASTSAVAFCVDDLDTDEDLGSVVCMPHLEDPRFEIFP
ncbi:delta(12) fatty acid desaturase-like protein [Tanacetum coccineum]